MLKADVQGSVEAVEAMVQQLASDRVELRVGVACSAMLLWGGGPREVEVLKARHWWPSSALDVRESLADGCTMLAIGVDPTV